MNIMISIDHEYMKYACIMLMSLKEHHKGVLLSVYILHNELTDEDFQQMDEIIGSEGIELIPVFIPKGIVEDFQIGEWPEEAAYRLLVADLFGNSLERILHLDVDILVTGDISEFYNTPFEGNYLVACDDFLSDEERRQKCSRFGKDEGACLFNSGVVLFNVSKLSEDGFYYAVYADILKKYPNIQIEYPDQDMLNMLFCDKTKYMDRIKYNYIPLACKKNDKEHFYDSPEELKKNCSIIHMISGTKSWVNVIKMAADDLWWEYAKRTPFYTDMKLGHVQAMFRREQKVNHVNHDRLGQLMQSVDSQEKLLKLEEMLYDILEQESEMIGLLNEHNYKGEQ